MTDYITTIGLEVHVQLKTRSKMFCSCAVEYGAEPNTNVCPVCMGMPGALPVMNEEALKLTALAGLMLGCEIGPVCKFDRKNYFYPDMPKNYQISQYDMPLCLGGIVPLHDLAYPKDAQKSIGTPNKNMRLVRIHLEEDVAKSFHMETATGIDYNRAGTPLMEIVGEPDISTPEEAFAYLTVLQQVMIYGGISDADMEKGQLRCDVNVSVRPVGTDKYGTKIEIKNLNSISGVRRALIFEIPRQVEILRNGGTLQQETRRWDDVRGETTLMRIKESAHDYRYFPDPDLLPLEIEQAWVDDIAASLPELPDDKKARFMGDFGLSDYDASVLTAEVANAAYFEKVAEGRDGKLAANWVINELFGRLKKDDKEITESPISAARLAQIVALIKSDAISGKIAKDVFDIAYTQDRDPEEIVETEGMKQVTDTGAIEAAVDEIIAANPDQVEKAKANPKLAGWFVGQVMKSTGGKANPAMVNQLVAAKLGL